MIPRPLLLALLVLTALAAGCLKDVAAPTPTNSTGNTTTGGNTTVAPMDVAVTVGESPNPGVPPTLYTLAPSKLELHVGMPVNLTLKNSGQFTHDLIIQGIEGAKVPAVDGGASKSVEFTPTEAGTFQMYCTVGSGSPTAHKDMGMSGTVTVV